MSHLAPVRFFAALGVVAILTFAQAPTAWAHETRRIGPYELRVGMLGEPVHIGQDSGLDLVVLRDGKPVRNLEQTLHAEVSFGESTLPLTLVPTEAGEGYEGRFVPTAAGGYSFHLTGTIEGTPIDERFTAGPSGFEEVVDIPAGEFPVGLPTINQVAVDAKRGADAAALVPLALAVGGAGLVIGLISIGIALATLRRSRPDT